MVLPSILQLFSALCSGGFEERCLSLCSSSTKSDVATSCLWCQASILVLQQGQQPGQLGNEVLWDWKGNVSSICISLTNATGSGQGQITSTGTVHPCLHFHTHLCLWCVPQGLCPWWCAHRCWIKSCCIVYWVPLSAPVLWKTNRQCPAVCTLTEEGCFKFARVAFVSSFLSNFKFLSFWVFDVMLSTFFWQRFSTFYFLGKKPHQNQTENVRQASTWVLDEPWKRSLAEPGPLHPWWEQAEHLSAPGRNHKLGKCEKRRRFGLQLWVSHADSGPGKPGEGQKFPCDRLLRKTWCRLDKL